jgi:GTP diphosphokinase / guanosine-3',5'-bis(diphosphate) 3'-diphosphatase
LTVKSAPASFGHGAIVDEALALAAEAHLAPRHRGETVIEHPIQVAALLAEAGYDQEVVAAGLLHDVVEDSTVGLDQVEARCGPEVRRLTLLPSGPRSHK